MSACNLYVKFTQEFIFVNCNFRVITPESPKSLVNIKAKIIIRGAVTFERHTPGR